MEENSFDSQKNKISFASIFYILLAFLSIAFSIFLILAIPKIDGSEAYKAGYVHGRILSAIFLPVLIAALFQIKNRSYRSFIKVLCITSIILLLPLLSNIGKSIKHLNTKTSIQQFGLMKIKTGDNEITLIYISDSTTSCNDWKKVVLQEMKETNPTSTPPYMPACFDKEQLTQEHINLVNLKSTNGSLITGNNLRLLLKNKLTDSECLNASDVLSEMFKMKLSCANQNVDKVMKI